MHWCAKGVSIRRLGVGDEVAAREMFAMMEAVFDEGSSGEPLDSEYIQALLERPDFFAVAAIDGSAIVGGVTGHALPMTRSCSYEMLIYDLAVRVDRRRQGIGRSLVTALRQMAAAEGIETSFVLADNDDIHALSFYRAMCDDTSLATVFTMVDST